MAILYAYYYISRREIFCGLVPVVDAAVTVLVAVSIFPFSYENKKYTLQVQSARCTMEWSALYGYGTRK